jgi:cephalosporin-C deacetylase
MPIIDMPLQQLKEYGGMNPRPLDFDAYWDKALKEMKSVNSNVEIKPNCFTTSFAECNDLYFTGVRGARIHVKHIKPKQEDKGRTGPAILFFHGYTGSAGNWTDYLSYAAAGASVFAMDVRGQGGSSEDTGGVKGNTLRGHIIRGLDSENPQDLLFRHVFLDTAQLAAIAMSFPEVDVDSVYATGWSQGGALTLACASLEPRVRKLAPVYPFLTDYKRVWQMDLTKDAYEELRIYFRFFDPQHVREEEIFTKLGYIDLQHLADRITGEVLMGVGLMDSVCPPSTQFAAYNKIVAPKSLEIYPDYAHEILPGLHDKIYKFLLG